MVKWNIKDWNQNYQRCVQYERITWYQLQNIFWLFIRKYNCASTNGYMSYLVRPVSPVALRSVKHCARGRVGTVSSFSDRPVIPGNIGEKQVWREKPTRCLPYRTLFTLYDIIRTKRPMCVTTPTDSLLYPSLLSILHAAPLFRPLALRRLRSCSGRSRSLPPPATAARSGGAHCP
jgi:hypothetical protein